MQHFKIEIENSLSIDRINTPHFEEAIATEQFGRLTDRYKWLLSLAEAITYVRNDKV